MARQTVRSQILVRSVQRLLDDTDQVRQVAFVWSRHRWWLPYAVFSAIALFVLSTALAIEPMSNRLVLGACAGAIAAAATTNYRIVAQTTTGLVLCRSSRLRQFAKSIDRWLTPTDGLEMVGSTVITSDWRIGGLLCTTTKRHEVTLRAIAIDRPS